MEILAWIAMIVLAGIAGWVVVGLTEAPWVGAVAGAIVAYIVEVLMNQYTQISGPIIPIIVGALVGFVIASLTKPTRAE